MLLRAFSAQPTHLQEDLHAASQVRGEARRYQRAAPPAERRRDEPHAHGDQGRAGRHDARCGRSRAQADRRHPRPHRGEGRHQARDREPAEVEAGEVRAETAGLTGRFAVRKPLAALLLAAVLAAAPPLSACAHAQADSPFEVVPRRSTEPHPHRLAYITAALGAGLVIASFPLEHEADNRYAAYLSETDVTKIDERFSATERMDRLASASLLVGEALIATAVWMRFVHHPTSERRVALALRPDRCALSLRF